MTEADTLFRAFGELFKLVGGEPNTTKLMDAIAKSPNSESITVTHKVCHVETDWLDAIERGLIFVGKAIEEDRQFIRTDGEVKPIEKVKHISKESVQHLSRHSDLITREQKADGDIVPDKLYTVEKDSDYAVYENRFLYMLLCYIREFVNVRYHAISDAYKHYRGEYKVTKVVKLNNRKLNFTYDLTEEQGDALVVPTDDECAQALSRINIILQSVAFYLRTPIMQEVSTVDKIGPKVTKTNVLLKDKNFFGALQLYEYLLDYDRDGYTVEQCVDVLPITEQLAKEFSVPTMLTAFLMFEHGLGLEKYLQAEFDKEELRRANERQKELKNKLAALKKKLEKTGESLEEYFAMLEERNSILENSYDLWQSALKDIEQLKAEIAHLKTEIELLQAEVTQLIEEKRLLQEEMERKEEEHRQQIAEMQRLHEEEIAALKASHEEEIAAIKASYEQQIAELQQRSRQELEQLKMQTAQQIANLKKAHADELANLRAEHSSRIESLKAEHKREKEKLVADCEKRVADSTAKLQESQSKVQNTLDELYKLRQQLTFTSQERDIVKARLLATRREHGLLTAADDFTTEEGFTALEHEFEVLCRMLSDEWNKVKALLRKEMFDQIRTNMHKRKQKESKEYKEIQQFVNARDNAASDAPQQDVDKGATDGESTSPTEQTAAPDEPKSARK